MILAADQGFSFGGGGPILALILGLAVFVAIGALSHEEERPFSASLIYLAIGVAIAGVVQLVDVSWLELVPDSAPLEHVSEIALMFALFATGLRIEAMTRRSATAATLLLTAVMIGTMAAVAAFGNLVMGLPLGAAIVLGALLAPTDPVLAGGLGAREPPAEDEPQREDTDAARALTVEAGVNDGLAAPFVLLGLFVAEQGGTAWLGEWVAADLVYASVLGIGVGVLVGYGMAGLADALRRRGLIAPRLDGWVGIGAALALFGAAEVAGGYGLLAAFAGGIGFRRYESEHEYDRRVHDTAETVQKFAELGVLLLFGSMLDFEGLDEPGVAGWLLAPLLILVLRPALTLVTLTRSGLARGERLFLAWFGVRGIASLYYVAFVVGAGVLTRAEADTVAWTAAVTVALSIVLHGVSASKLRERWIGD